MYARPIEALLRALSKLPGVGPRTAERYVFHLLKAGKRDVAELATALQTLITSVRSCDTCFDFSDQSPCGVCRDAKRDRSTICVVADPSDMQALERSRVFHGMYHVLRGTIDPAADEENTMLKTAELLRRVRTPDIKEIILAFNPDVAGETTMMYLERQLRNANVHLIISRLARGLPMGSDLRYADDITLGSALSHRTKS
jgi:recombination protein RecR